MRISKFLLFIVLVWAVVVCSGHVALAIIGSSSGDTSSLKIYPNAPGTKYEGPLTLYFKSEYLLASEYVSPEGYAVECSNNGNDSCSCLLIDEAGQVIPPDNYPPPDCYLINGVCHVKIPIMYIFLRLRKGSDTYPFSGIAEGVIYEDIGAQQAAVESFFHDNVMPVLYRDVDPMPQALLKSVDLIVSDNETLPEGEGCCDEMSFVILDVVIAVQE